MLISSKSMRKIYYLILYIFFFCRGVLRELSNCSGSDWQNHIKSLLSEGQYTPPKKGKDVGDHPPITPVKSANASSVGGGDSWRLYDYICRHFIATV